MDNRRKNLHNRRMTRGFKHWLSPETGHLGTLRIRGIGWREEMPACFIDRPHGTGDYLIMRFDSPVSFAAADGLRERAPGTLAIWPPGLPQRYGNHAAGFVHSWIHCAGASVAQLLRTTRLPVNQALPVPDPVAMDDALLALHVELTRWPVPDAVVVRNLLENWLRQHARELRQPPASAPPPGLLAAKHRLESELDYRWTLDELAKVAGRSKQHFGAEFKKHFGAAPIAHLLEARLRFAAHLLADRNRRVEAVARESGFADAFYFSRAFRRQFGMSPRTWRNRPAR